jgi:hypothetical protein
VSTEGLEKLPTGKFNISFSEMNTWSACSYRHKLQFVDKIDLFKPGVHMDFGTSVHAAHEHFIKTRTIDNTIFFKKLRDLWAEHAKILPEVYTVESFMQFAIEGKAILADLPAFYDTTFPGWQPVDAEHFLFEHIEGHPHAFKGFIDAIIQAPGSRGKMLTWILDAKTTSWGWSGDKKSDPKVCAQLVLYKNFWSVKTKTDPKDVRCGFVLLKRSGKPGKHCELVTTSVGEVTTHRTLKVINNMVSSIKKGIAMKNRNACRFCEYFNTPHCT